MTEITEFDPTKLSPAELYRSDLYFDFTDNPNSSTVWQTVYDEVKSEEATGEINGIVDLLPAEELIAFAERIRSEPISGNRYGLTTEQTTLGKRWFDVLEGFTDESLESAKNYTYSTIRHRTHLKHPFERSLDIGVGNGNSIKNLEDFSDSVVGIDIVPELLAIAKKRTKENTDLVLADATGTPFADESFDFIESAGVAYAFDKTSLELYYSEISRLLMPGGSYIEGVASRDENGRFDKVLHQAYKSAKSLLAQMIVDYTSGENRFTDNVTEEEKGEIIESVGLNHRVWIVDHPDGSRSLFRLLFKPIDDKDELPAWVGRTMTAYYPMCDSERRFYYDLEKEGVVIRGTDGGYRSAPKTKL